MTDETMPPAMRRMLVKVPVHAATLIDLVARYAARRKRSIVDEIWAAGMRDVLGVTPAELAGRTLAVPTDITVQRNVDLKELTTSLCRKA